MDAVHALVRAMIHSHLDYRNSLLAGLPTGQMSRLQSVLHAAARLVLGLPGRAPVSAAMHDILHWLSFPQHVPFKLCLLTYKCLHGLAPDYLSCFCMLLNSVPGRPLLRSADTNCWYHGPARPALDCVPSVLLVRLPGMISQLICAIWTYL